MGNNRDCILRTRPEPISSTADPGETLDETIGVGEEHNHDPDSQRRESGQWVRKKKERFKMHNPVVKRKVYIDGMAECGGIPGE